MITGLAHSGVCVPDCEAAVAFYRDVLGMRVLSPPYVMAGDAIRYDMGQPGSDRTMKPPRVGSGDSSGRPAGASGPPVCNSVPTACGFWASPFRPWRGGEPHGSATRVVWCSSS